MDWKALISLVFITSVCLGEEDKDLPASKSTVEKFLKDYVRKETCSLPEDMDGQWATTLWGNITVSGFVLQTDYKFGGSENNDLECYLTSDTGETVLRGRKTIYMNDEEFEILTCIEIIPRNADSYHIIVKTDRNDRLGNEPLKLRPLNASSSGETDFVSCEKDSSKWLHGNMIRIGKEKSAAVSCPPALIGSFSLSYLDRLGSSKCPNGARMLSSAARNSPLLIDYSGCSQSDQNEEKETFWCVAVSGIGVTVYKEGQEKSPFSCVSLKADPLGHHDRMIYTQRQGACGKTWTKSSHVSDNVWLRIAFLSHTKEHKESHSEKNQSPPYLLMPKDAPILAAANSSKSHIIISKLSEKEKGEEKVTDVTSRPMIHQNGDEDGKNVGKENVTPVSNSSIDEGNDFFNDGALNLVPEQVVFILSLLLATILLQ